MDYAGDLLNRITNSKIPPLCILAGAELNILRDNLSLDIDEGATPYEKSLEKDYSLIEKINYSDDYKYLLNVELVDYGFESDDEESVDLETYISEQSEIEYWLDHIDLKEKKITLKGSVCGDIMFLSTVYDFKVILKLTGVKYEENRELLLHQELLIDGYILEIEKNYKMAFFTYFTAFEAFVALKISKIKDKIYEELHYSLERLDFIDKVRIIGRVTADPLSISKIPLWGELIKIAKKLKDKRNDIAHGKPVAITKEDIDSCFFATVVFIAMIESKNYDFLQIRKFLYPKKS